MKMYSIALLSFLLVNTALAQVSKNHHHSTNQTTEATESSTANSAGTFVIIALGVGGFIVYKVIQNNKRKELIANMISKYPQYEEEIKTKYSGTKTVRADMPYHVVEFIFGNPGDTKESFNGKKLKVNCFYGSHISRRGKVHYSYRIDFEGTCRDDLKVFGWKELV